MRSVGPFPLCVFSELEVRHQILKGILGILGAYSSSALRHVVCGDTVSRVLVTMLVLHSGPETTDVRGRSNCHECNDHPIS